MANKKYVWKCPKCGSDGAGLCHVCGFSTHAADSWVDKRKPEPPSMTHQDKQDVLAKLDWEGGYDYFNGGSNFPEYTDPEFRELVKDYQDATEALGEFLGKLEVGEDEEE